MTLPECAPIFAPCDRVGPLQPERPHVDHVQCSDGGTHTPVPPAVALADEEALRQVFHAEYSALTAEARADLGDDARALAPKVVEGAFVRAWDARARFHTPAEVHEFLVEDVHHAAARALSRRVGCASPIGRREAAKRTPCRTRRRKRRGSTSCTRCTARRTARGARGGGGALASRSGGAHQGLHARAAAVDPAPDRRRGAGGFVGARGIS